MKKGLALKIFFATAAAILLPLLITCNQPASGGVTITSTLTIRFNSSNVSCWKQGGTNEEVSSDAKVYEGDKLYFTATPGAGKKVAQWKIGNQIYTPHPGSGNGFWYTVQAGHAAEGVIAVSFDEAAAQEITLNFGSNISCRKQGGTNEEVSSGSTVYEGEKLRFEGTPSPGKKIAQWKIGNQSYTPNAQSGNGYSYTVQASHADTSGVIAVSFDEAAAQEITLNLGSNVSCRKQNSNTAVSSGSTVYEGEELRFEATLSAGKKVAKWQIGNQSYTPHPGSGNGFWYMVQAGHADTSGVIAVSFEEEAAQEITFNFDSNIRCRKQGASGEISSGSKVYEGEKLRFEGIPSPGKKIAQWKIGNQSYTPNAQSGNGYSYTVQAGHAAEGVIAVSFDEAAAQETTLNLGLNISCRKQNSNTAVSSGSTVYEGEELRFEATPSAGKKVKQWTIGNKTYTPSTYQGNGYGYTVQAADASGGVINVSFEETNVDQIPIVFDSNIKCEKQKDPNNWSNWISVSTGTQVEEDSQLRFSEKNPLPADEVADWKVNGEDRTVSEQQFYYRVNAADKGADGKIQVTMTQRPVKNITVKVLKPDIKCYKNGGSEEVSLTALEAVVKEKTQLMFKTDPEKSVMWIINGREQYTTSNFGLYVHKSGADGTDTITINYK